MSSLTESWIKQQGDLQSAVLQERARRLHAQLQTALAEHKQHKQALAEHVQMQQSVNTKIRKLDEQLSRTPFGVTGTWQSGEKFKKFFESVDHRSHWINYNEPRMNSHDLIEPDHVKQVQRKLQNLI